MMTARKPAKRRAAVKKPARPTRYIIKTIDGKPAVYFFRPGFANSKFSAADLQVMTTSGHHVIVAITVGSGRQRTFK